MISPTNTLRRHAERRRQRVPTVTVFTGPVGSALALWRRHHEAASRPIVIVGSSAELHTGWLDSFNLQDDLIPLIAEHLGSKCGWSGAEIISKLRGWSRYELEAFLDNVLPDESPPSVSWLCRSLLRRVAERETDANGESVGSEFNLPLPELMVAICQLVPVEQLPALMLAEWPTEQGGVARGIAAVARIAVEAPAVPIAMHVDSRWLQTYFESAGNHRDAALVREGVIALQELGKEDVNRLVAPELVAAGGVGSAVQLLTRQGGSEKSFQRFADAVRATALPRYAGRAETTADQDRARSAAERYLFDRLQHHPRFAGLFMLNERIELPTGPHGSCEVDLVSRETRVAIEIDGYFHFLDSEAYRRDRRKDFALQLAGYTVLRFLAEDVVRDLEQILARIDLAMGRAGADRASASRNSVW